MTIGLPRKEYMNGDSSRNAAGNFVCVDVGGK
jgi:hypothetical protein